MRICQTAMLAFKRSNYNDSQRRVVLLQLLEAGSLFSGPRKEGRKIMK